MTREENIATLNEHLDHWKRLLSEKICDQDEGEKTIDALQNAIKALQQEPCEDCISREHLLEEIASLKESPWFKDDTNCSMAIRKEAIEIVEDLCIRKEPSVNPQKYEYHIDHTDCIWYGSDSGCPVTCSQYRDGWNDAMDYIFKNGKGYQPYRRDG
ncbi:MAG TPA: hypothetical protein DHV77_01560 [Erysipelotrichaceae bacterium]|nr:hypothetical protein [Erysipelotrichaceae bacterium]